MKLSARNVFKGRITEVHLGPTTARIKIQVAPGVVVTASIHDRSGSSRSVTKHPPSSRLRA
jgi:molybdopterin-binding protein